MELLIRVVNRSPIPELNLGDSMAGDVIVACPDGWRWSVAELTNPEWRIVRLPLTQEEADALTASESRDDDVPALKRLQRIDLTTAKDLISVGDQRRNPIINLTTRADELKAAVVTKPTTPIAEKLPDEEPREDAELIAKMVNGLMPMSMPEIDL